MSANGKAPKRSDPTPARILDVDFDAVAYEQANVHSVYNAIASHFSETRYKPWPLVPAFLDTFQAGSVGADLGAGNGKYLPCGSVLHAASPGLLTIGSDRSDQLIDLAYRIETSKDIRNEVTVADAMTSNFRSQAFDYAISIAAIHHFSTHERRKQAVHEMIRLVRPRSGKPGKDAEESLGTGSGRFMIYAWAMEQRGHGRRAGKFDGETAEQDVLVPWVLAKNASRPEPDAAVFQRYYHLFKENELDELVQEAAATFENSPHAKSCRVRNVQVHKEASGWEKGNWWGVWSVYQIL